jgi:mRNA interferase HigB
LIVIAKKILRDFWQKHSDCEQQLKSWYGEAEKGEWKTLNEIKKEYPSAGILKDNTV